MTPQQWRMMQRGRGGSSTVRQVATATHPASLASTQLQSMTRSRHVMRDSVTQLQIGLGNFVCARLASGVEQGSGGAITFSAAIEYPIDGACTQIKWGGSATVSVANLTNAPLSDAAIVTIPIGTAFMVRIYQNAAVGAILEDYAPLVGSFPEVAAQNTANGELCNFALSGLTDQTMTPGAITGGTASTRYRLSPLVIVAPTTVKSVYIAGDSLSIGWRDVFTSTGDIGTLPRSIGQSLPYGCFGQGGSTAANFTTGSNSALRRAWKGYFTHLAINFGINDLIGGTSAAQIITDLSAVPALFPGMPPWCCTVTPQTTTTDNWASAANQTVSAFSATQTTLNDLIRASVPNYTGFFEVADQMMTARNSNKWKGASGFQYCADGLHSVAFANTQLLASGAINPAVFV